MMAVVLDANGWVSVLIVPVGKPAEILTHSDRLGLLTSEEILSEVERVLHYPRIQRKYGLSEARIGTYLERVREVSRLVAVRTRVEVITTDPDDNKLLGCAVDGGAEYIVSEDPHLLSLGQYQGIGILSPAALLRLLSG